jgi:polar amino acid transport system substrate-binding protein
MKINRWLGRLIIVVLAGTGWLVFQQLQQQNGLAEIQRRGRLRIGLDASFPPFEVLDETGQVVGLDADIARMIAADLGVEAQFVNIGFDGLYDALKVGKVDMLLSALPVDPYLTRDIAYSVSYFNAGQVLVTTRPDIESVADLAGQRVAVEWGSLGDMEARRLGQTLPGLQIDPKPDSAAAMQSEIAIVDAVNALGNPKVRVVTYLTDEPYAAAVKIEDKALLAAINQTLNRLLKTGEIERLQSQWFSKFSR